MYNHFIMKIEVIFSIFMIKYFYDLLYGGYEGR